MIGDLPPVTEAYAEVVKLAAALGVRDLPSLDGCWEHQVDAQWWIAMNGHDDPVTCSKGCVVQPMEICVVWHGWPAGSIGPFDGGMFQVEPPEPGEVTFIRAVKAAAAAAAEAGHG